MSDYLDRYYYSHNGRLPTKPIPDENKDKVVGENKSLKVFK